VLHNFVRDVEAELVAGGGRLLRVGWGESAGELVGSDGGAASRGADGGTSVRRARVDSVERRERRTSASAGSTPGVEVAFPMVGPSTLLAQLRRL
jgi:hypothetical protein